MVELKFGVGITQSFAPSELIALAQQCESHRYHHLWYANHKLGRDHYVGLTLIALHTKHIRVGTFIAEPYSYHPGMIAAAVGTIDELSEGRAMLLLGAGAANFDRLGLVRDNPVAALRDTITICRALLAAEEITYHGERFSIKNG